MSFARHNKRSEELRSQSAMEYLMTYGWAILIIAVVLGALFQLGIFSSTMFATKVPPGACQVQRVGSGITAQVSLAGECQGELPEFVATMSNEIAFTAPESSSLDTVWSGGSYTLTAWVKVTSFTGTPNNKWLIEENDGCTAGMWINPVGTTGSQFQEIEWYQPTGMKTGNACVSSAGGGATSSVTLPLNTWGFATAIFNSTASVNNVVACTDGICTYSTLSIPTGNSPEDYATWGYQLVVGSGSCCGSPTLDIQMADVQLYNITLGPAEVNALYVEGIGGAPIRPQNIVAWYPLNSNVNDYSGNNNAATYSQGIGYTSQLNGYSTP